MKAQFSERVRKKILETNGKIFRVTFIKRTNGEMRRMVARIGVKSHLRGGGQAYNPKNYDLLTVFDMQKKEYRNINLNNVISLKIGGEETINKL